MSLVWHAKQGLTVPSGELQSLAAPEGHAGVSSSATMYSQSLKVGHAALFLQH